MSETFRVGQRVVFKGSGEGFTTVHGKGPFLIKSVYPGVRTACLLNPDGSTPIGSAFAEGLYVGTSIITGNLFLEACKDAVYGHHDS